MKGSLGCFFIALLAVIAIVAKESIYTIDEREQVLVTRFGEVQGSPIIKAGINFKIPFVDKVNFFPKQILEWDGRSTEMPTKDKTYISVNSYARWQIKDVETYFKRLNTEPKAITRLDTILGSETRTVVAKNDLIELIRTTKDRKPLVDEDIKESDSSGTVGVLSPIRRGRTDLEKEIFETSKPKLSEFGIELLDIRFKRINYNETVLARIYERMISERQQIAERFRSEGAGEAAKILGNMEKDLAEIESFAYKQAETLKGQADAKATDIYSKAFGRSTEAADFYEFVRTMELYETMFSNESTIIMSTDSDMFKYLRRVAPDNATPALPVARPAAAPAASPAPAAQPAAVVPGSQTLVTPQP